MEGIIVLHNTTSMEVICKTTQIWPILNCLPSQREWVGREGWGEVGTQSFRNNCRVLFLQLGNRNTDNVVWKVILP